MSMTPLPGRDAGVSTQLEAATRLFRASLFKLLPEAMIAALLGGIPAEYARIRGLTLSVQQMPQDSSFVFVYFASLLAMVFTLGVIVVRQNDLLRGAPTSLTRELQHSLRRLPAMLVAMLLASLIVSIGSTLLVAPGAGVAVRVAGVVLFVAGFWLAVCFSILNCVVVLEPVGPIRALRVCVERIRPVWWKACAIVVIGVLVMLVCMLAAAAVIGVLIALAGDPRGTAAQAIQAGFALLIMGLAICFLLSLVRVLYSSASSSA